MMKERLGGGGGGVWRVVVVVVVVMREERAETERRSGDGWRIREKDIASFKCLNDFGFVLT